VNSIDRSRGGRTFVMMPTMVPTKTAKRCQALTVTPTGAGMHQMMRPASTEYPRGLSFAPFHSAFGATAASPACTIGAGVALAVTTRFAEARWETADVALEELRGAHAGVRLRRATRVVGNPASGSPRRISGANVGRDRRSGRVRHHHGGHLNVDTFDQTDGRRHTPRVSNWRDDARDCAFPRITLLSQS
jgi:hypothetical protein